MTKVITTRDGSRSIFSTRFQQHYHNISGAMTESRNVFFDNTGLSKALAEHREITLCEVGFGTGLHVVLLECMRKRTGSRSNVHYYSVEKYPLDGSLVRRMDFGRICQDADRLVGQLADALFAARDGESVSMTIRSDPDEKAPANPSNKQAAPRHDDSGSTGSTGNSDSTGSTGSTGNPMQPCNVTGLLTSWEQDQPANSPFTRVEVFRGDFFDWDLSQINGPAHFILHDAFSPDANPDLWTVPTFQKLLGAADPGAILGTYCSATKARAAMVLAGWHVARVQGPPGKREVTVASPTDEALSGFKRVNEAHLADRFREELS